MPDITLPNGVVLKNVPEGVNKYDLMQKAVANGAAKWADFGHANLDEDAEKYDPTEGNSFLTNTLIGFDRGVTHTGQQIGNILGFVSDEEIADQKSLDESLMSTWGGNIGSIVGELAVTGAPIGGAAGAGVRGAQAGLRATRAARGAPSVLNRGATAVAGSPITRGAVEGAAYGSLYGGPDNRGTGAMVGSTIGGTFGGAGQLLGKMWGNFRIAGLTDEAKELMETTGQFIPLSQSSKGIPRMLYNAILANLPGVSGKIRKQYGEAVNDLRRWVGEQAHPGSAQIEFTPEMNIRQVFDKLDEFWSTAYDDIAKTTMNTTGLKIPKGIKDLIKAENPAYRIPKGGQVTGKQLMNLRNGLSEMRYNPQLTSGSFKGSVRKQLDDSIAQVDDVLRKSLDGDQFAYYESLRPYYKNYQTLMGSMKNAAGDAQEFTTKELLAQATRRGKLGEPDVGSVQAIARLGKEALPDFPSREGIFQVAASLGLATSVLAGAGVPALIGSVAVIGIGKLMATKGFQKFISGQHRGAELLAHPQFALFLKAAGYSGRQQAAIRASIKEGEDKDAT